ncbi:tetratricopeptide repeat protein [Kamptonema formosum]|uniref:tetratricopeptide repeat protein n=1 Tax=Kamptonema formosum TaxID=331992 RepID=UPI0003457D81|nr:tetratricopeptide repeat protein [Oscillatoria sp. PCC 10802]
MVWEWLRNVVKTVADTAKFILAAQMYIPDRQAESAQLTIAANRVLADRRDEMQVAQLKLQYLQQAQNREFQGYLAEPSREQSKYLPDKNQAFLAEWAKLNQERAKELQDYILNAQIVIYEKNIDFQQWRLEQEKALQLQLLELNHQFQRSMAAYQRETSLKVIEEQKRLENSPIWLVASDILNSHAGEEIIPLRIFFAPPKLQFEPCSSAANAGSGFPDIELTLAEGLRNFFLEYSDRGRALDFMGGAWVSKSYHSEASIKALFSALKSEPTLVLESEVDGDYLNFRVAYWSLNWPKYRYRPAISRLPYRHILHEAAKARARKWPETRAWLIAAGEKPEEVDRLFGGDSLKNWEILQREERLREAGIDAENLELNYIVSKKDCEDLCQFLIVYHCLFAGLVADEYFLFEYNLPPVLPQLLPALTQQVPDTEAVREIIKGALLYYHKIFEVLSSQRSALVLELSLDLARNLAHLPEKVWAKEEVIYSVQSWLKLHGFAQHQGWEAMLDDLHSALTVADLAYVEKLNECLEAIGESRRLSVIDACYNRGVSRFEQGEYKAAIPDFNQAIQLNPQWADAFYNRGLAYAQLGQYQKAIEDYSAALQIHPNSAPVYCNRGYAYYKLGQHEPAIADYDLALSSNPNLAEAAKNREIVQGVWDELKRKEEERKCRLENASVAHTLAGHSSDVNCLAISPDGQTLVSASWDSTVKVWQLSTGKELRTLTGHSSSVHSLAISPDGQRLASGSADKTVKIWQLSTGEELRTLSGHSSYIHSLAISPDGQTLVSGSGDRTIKIWQLSTGQELRTLTGHSNSVISLAISPDGQTLASGSCDSTVKFWQLNTGEELRTLTGHSHYVYSLAISPDGQTLVSGSADKTIKIWRVV